MKNILESFEKSFEKREVKTIDLIALFIFLVLVSFAVLYYSLTVLLSVFDNSITIRGVIFAYGISYCYINVRLLILIGNINKIK